MLNQYEPGDFEIGNFFTSTGWPGYTFKIKNFRYTKNEDGLVVPTVIFFEMWNPKMRRCGTCEYQGDISPEGNFLEMMEKLEASKNM